MLKEIYTIIVIAHINLCIRRQASLRLSLGIVLTEIK